LCPAPTFARALAVELDRRRALQERRPGGELRGCLSRVVDEVVGTDEGVVMDDARGGDGVLVVRDLRAVGDAREPCDRRHVARHARLLSTEVLVVLVLIPRLLEDEIDPLLLDPVLIAIDPHLVAVLAELVRVGEGVPRRARVEAVPHGAVQVGEVRVAGVVALLHSRGESPRRLLRGAVELVARRAADAVAPLRRVGLGEAVADGDGGDGRRVAVDAELRVVGVRDLRERTRDDLVGLRD